MKFDKFDKHMTGYALRRRRAGSRDYVGTPQSPQRAPHISTHPTEKQNPTLSHEF